ncbi:hypothetical protein NE865_04378 [Phthorimaea operculella]|nr:hypothetical protein NE865_04378 [Phthorimaea operculella]
MSRLEQVASTTFLGYEIDRSLTWEAHIEKVCGRLGGACFALWRLARVVPRAVARSCYFATVHSLLTYGAELWGCAAEWQRAFRMQKRAIRAIVNVAQDESAKPFFSELGILTFPSLVIYQIAIYAHTHLADYRLRGDLAIKSLRHAGRLQPIKHRLAKSSKLTHVMAPSIYNRLPKSVTEAPSLQCFKSRLKRWLLEHTFYSLNEFFEIKLT